MRYATTVLTFALFATVAGLTGLYLTPDSPAMAVAAAPASPAESVSLATASAEARKPALGHQKLLQMVGPKVVDSTKTQRDSGPLAQKKYMLLYFSALWCPPCRAFTPDLVTFYEKQRDTTSHNFDLLFVSSDRTQEAQMQYMTEYKMPWAAVPFDRIEASGVRKAYGARGIPNLVVLDQDGKVVFSSYVDGKFVGPRKVLADFEKLLKS